MLIITAFQRSGTTAFGEAIEQSGSGAYFGEIFHPEGAGDSDRAHALRLRPRANYFAFANAHGFGASLPTSNEDLAQQWIAYRSFLHDLAQDRRPVIDIKYNSWFNLTSVWQAPNHLPWLMQIVADDDDATVLHCVRDNLFHQALSEAIAWTTGQYHRTGTTPAATEKVTVDPPLVLQRMRDSLQQTAIVRDWLRHVRHLEFRYETMFDHAGRLSASCQALLRDAFVTIEENDRPVLAKIDTDHFARIRNIEEVCVCLRHSEFADDMPRWWPERFDASARSGTLE